MISSTSFLRLINRAVIRMGPQELSLFWMRMKSKTTISIHSSQRQRSWSYWNMINRLHYKPRVSSWRRISTRKVLFSHALIPIEIFIKISSPILSFQSQRIQLKDLKVISLTRLSRWADLLIITCMSMSLWS